MHAKPLSSGCRDMPLTCRSLKQRELAGRPRHRYEDLHIKHQGRTNTISSFWIFIRLIQHHNCLLTKFGLQLPPQVSHIVELGGGIPSYTSSAFTAAHHLSLPIGCSAVACLLLRNCTSHDWRCVDEAPTLSVTIFFSPRAAASRHSYLHQLIS